MRDCMYIFCFISVCLAFVVEGCSPKGYEKYKYLVEDKHSNGGKNGSSTHENGSDISYRELDENIKKVLEKAESYKGVRYKYGGMTSKGMDCSGLVCQSFAVAGLNLPHSTQLQAKMGKSVRRSDLRPGNLVFFRMRKGSKVSHVGIVSRIRGGQTYFIHASTSRGVVEDRLDDEYWLKYFDKGVDLGVKEADLGAR